MKTKINSKVGAMATAVLAAVLATNTMAQPVYQSSVTAIGESDAAVVGKPAGTGAGELLVVGLMIHSFEGSAITPPAEWTLVERVDNDNDVTMATYYLLTGGAEPASYTFNLEDSEEWAIGITRISEFNTASPINASKSSKGGKAGKGGKGAKSSKGVVAPSVTTTVANTLVLAFYTNKDEEPMTPEGTTTERYDHPNDDDTKPANMMATFVQASAGATGDKKAMPDDEDDEWIGMQIAIAPISVLPIELLSFRAYQGYNDEVEIEWVTATETNNQYFTIERYNEEYEEWEELEQIPGAGNSSAELSYSTADYAAKPGITYYRLKQTDYDGTYTYSPEVAVDVDGPQTTEIKVFPNPAQDYLTVEGSRAELEEVHIFNMNGQCVDSQVELITKNYTTVAFNIGTLAPGMYIVKTRNKSMQLNKM